MRIARRRFMPLAGAVLVAPALSRSAFGQAPVTLRLHHFLPPVSNVHTKLLTPWVKTIEQESGGRLKIDIFPSMQLGGTPSQLYDQARDGAADIVWVLPGLTPGRFPRIEVFELPFVADKRAAVNARGVQDFFDGHLREEFKETQILCVWAHDHGLIHATRPVNSMEDIKGLKLRSPTRRAGDALTALGANAIAMPIPQVPDALAQRVIDGCVVPWEVVPAIKLHELVKNHTEIFGSPTLYTATFTLAMNKPKYDGLPPDLKKVLDQNSGQAFAEAAGKMWDEQAILVESLVKSRGNTVIRLSKDESQRWQKATRPVVDAWLKQAKDKGLNGEKLLADARAAIAKFARS